MLMYKITFHKYAHKCGERKDGDYRNIMTGSFGSGGGDGGEG